MNLGGKELAQLRLQVAEVLQCLVLLRIVKTLHATHVVLDVQHLRLRIIALQMQLFLYLLHVVVELLESVGSCSLVLFDVALQALKAISQIFNISPSSICLSSLDLLCDLRLIRKVRIVQVSVVAEEEGREVQGEIAVFLLLSVDNRGDVHLPYYDFVRFESSVDLRI